MQNEFGIDIQQTSEWISSRYEHLKAPYEFNLISGGRSNLTFEVTDSLGHKVCLRRPPVSHVLPTAHDMAREFKIISSLNQVNFAVPKTIGICTDLNITGSTFYLMEFVEGYILRDVEALADLGTPFRSKASRSLIEALYALHSIDPDAIGLGDLAKKQGYIERQLKRWFSQFLSSQELTGRVVKSVEQAYHYLSSNVPAQTRTSIVHGDYRLDNCVLDFQGNLLAVLDWELCTLGDPMADLGLLMVYWAEEGDPITALESAPTAEGGFMSRQEMANIYSSLGDIDIEKLDYYVAFGYWKLACILEGVFSRYALGAGAGDQRDYRIYGEQVDILANRALEIISGKSL